MSESQTPQRQRAFASTRGLRGERVIMAHVEPLVDRLAAEMTLLAHQRVGRTGVFHLALSGGSTPEALYRHLMIDPRYRLMPWSKTHLWQVDERAVPHEDDRSNFKILREMIVQNVDIPEPHVHAMPAVEDDGDERYEKSLRRELATAGCDDRLDFVLLGMGADGHTASLFPNTPALNETERWIVFNDGETVAPPRPRMTMTYPLINHARRIAVLVTGEKKHAALQHVSLAAEDIDRFPITGVEPAGEDSKLTWYLDEPAAAGPASE